MPSPIAILLAETAPAVMDVIRDGARAAKRSDLTLPQLRALGYLERHEGASLSELASHVGLTAPATSQIVDGLVERRLLRRAAASEDRRRVRLSVTASGKAQLADARAGAHAMLDDVLARLAPADISKLEAGLAALRRALQREVSA